MQGDALSASRPEWEAPAGGGLARYLERLMQQQAPVLRVGVAQLKSSTSERAAASLSALSQRLRQPAQPFKNGTHCNS